MVPVLKNVVTATKAQTVILSMGPVRTDVKEAGQDLPAQNVKLTHEIQIVYIMSYTQINSKIVYFQSPEFRISNDMLR